MRDKLGKFLKGHRASIKTEFKRGENLGKTHRNWTGGRYKLKNGYIWTYAIGHPKAYRNGIYEHILVAEKKLGRYLKKGECVHHINRIKDDNRPENVLTFPSNGEHISKHTLDTWSKKYNECRRCGTLEREHDGRGLCSRCYKNCQYNKKLCLYK